MRTFRPPFAAIGSVPRARTIGDLTAQPAYQAALQSIGSQMQNEGQPSLNVAGAQQAFGNLVNELVTNTDAASAISAAQSYVLGTQTIGGAVDTISNLLQGPQGVTTPQQAASFVGQMVGVMSLIGAVSGVSTAGVGAAIVGGLSFVLQAMDAAHLFGAPLGGTSLCHCSQNNLQVNTPAPPAYLLPCPPPWGSSSPNLIAVDSDPLWDPTHKSGIQPGASNWRSFPSWSGSLFDPNMVWYTPWSINPQWTPPDQSAIQYTVCPCPNGGSFFGSALRLVDLAFPMLHHMECERAGLGPLVAQLSGGDPEIAAALTSFEPAFIAALKANWEFALNGMSPPASDIDVLAHTIYVWNRAHAPGKGFGITPSNATPWTANGTVCDGSAPPWYAAILAPQAGSKQQLPGVMQGGQLHINTGPLLPFTLGGVSRSATPSGGTAGLLLVGTSVAAAAGLGAAALVAHQRGTSTANVLRGAWKSVSSGVQRAAGRAKGIFR